MTLPVPVRCELEASGGGQDPLGGRPCSGCGCGNGRWAAGGQGFNKGAVVPEGEPQVEGGDVGVAAHRLYNEVRHHRGVPITKDELGDAHRASSCD